MNSRNAYTLAALLAAVLLVVGCASEPEPEPEPEPEQDTAGLPDFYLNPPQAEDTLYGVGSADMASLDNSRRMAVARAREDIAFQMNAAIEASITDYAQEAGADGNDPQVIEFVETVSRQVSDITLEGATTDEVAQGEDGAIFALVSYPKDGFQDAAAEAFSRNEDAAFAEFQADQALEQLDQNLEEQPPNAGNIEEGVDTDSGEE